MCGSLRASVLYIIILCTLVYDFSNVIYLEPEEIVKQVLPEKEENEEEYIDGM